MKIWCAVAAVVHRLSLCLVFRSCGFGVIIWTGIYIRAREETHCKIFNGCREVLGFSLFNQFLEELSCFFFHFLNEVSGFSFDRVAATITCVPAECRRLRTECTGQLQPNNKLESQISSKRLNENDVEHNYRWTHALVWAHELFRMRWLWAFKDSLVRKENLFWFFPTSHNCERKCKLKKLHKFCSLSSVNTQIEIRETSSGHNLSAGQP